MDFVLHSGQFDVHVQAILSVTRTNFSLQLNFLKLISFQSVATLVPLLLSPKNYKSPISFYVTPSLESASCFISSVY